jgi:hypothetical protein
MLSSRPLAPAGMAAGDGFLWVIDQWAPFLLGIDAATGAVATLKRIDLPFEEQVVGLRGLTFGHEALWLPLHRSVARIDPRSGGVSLAHLEPSGPSSYEAHPVSHLLVTDDAVWVAGRFQDHLSRLDPATGRIAGTMAVPPTLHGLAGGPGLLWMLDGAEGALVGLGEGSGHIEHSLPLGGRPTAVEAAGGRVWAAAERAELGPDPETGRLSWLRREGSRLISADAATGRLLSRFDVPDLVLGLFPFRDGLYAPRRRLGGDTHRVARLDPADGRVLGELPFERLHGLIERQGALWGLVPRVQGRETGSVVRIDPTTDKITRSIDLAQVDTSPLISPPPAALPPGDFERRFRTELERTLSEQWQQIDHRIGEVIASWSVLGRGRALKSVLMQGEYPATKVVILFTDERNPRCLFGLRLPVWHRDGESWGMGPDDAASLLWLDVFEETPGVTVPDKCDPDENGVTWVD